MNGQKKAFGFSLIEVMVVVAVSSIMALGFGNLIMNGLKGEKTVEGRYDINNTVSEMRTFLQDGPTCLVNLTGKNPTATFTQTNLNNVSGTAIYQSGQNAPGSSSVQITSMTVGNYVATNPSVSAYIGTSTLSVTFLKLGSQYSTPSITKMIYLSTTLNASNTITACRALPGMTDGLWTLLGNQHDIYYTNGNVGIGTASPGALLEVANDAKIHGMNLGTGPDTAHSVGLGQSALAAMTTGNANTAVGMQTLMNNTTGNYNTAIGYNTLAATTAGYSNTALGGTALLQNVSGNSNTAIGTGALVSATGSGNTALGAQSGSAITNQQNVVILGGFSGTGMTSNQISVSDGAGNERVRIDSAGNIGIGMSTPAVPLHLYSSNSDLARFVSNGNQVNIYADATGSGIFNLPGPTSPNATGLYMNTDLGFYANGTQKMTLQGSTGNVGIGTATPASSLDVSGLIRSTQYAAPASGVGVEMTYVPAGPNGYVQAYDRSNSVYKPLRVNGSTLYLNADSGGNVGIGTSGTAPFSQLQISSAIQNVLTATTTSSSTAYFYLKANAQGWGIVANGTAPYAANAGDFWIDQSGMGPRILIQGSSGNVGIGTSIPATTLDVAGNINAQTVTYTSDQRLKKDIIPIDSPLQKLLTLNPVTYYWNELAKSRGMKDEGKRHMGLLAQEVERVFPEAVFTAKDGFKSVDYGALIAPAIGAIQELKAENLALKNKNSELESRLQQLEAAVGDLKSKSH